MCDYSLQGLPNRLAAEGEELVTYRFRTGSIGMASPNDIAARLEPKAKDKPRGSWWSAVKCWLTGPLESQDTPAVCIPPGTRLHMSGVPEQMCRQHGLKPEEDVTFVQLSAEAFQYRDAIQCANGNQVILQAFRLGVKFQVLSTGESSGAEHVTEHEASVISPDSVLTGR